MKRISFKELQLGDVILARLLVKEKSCVVPCVCYNIEQGIDEYSGGYPYFHVYVFYLENMNIEKSLLFPRGKDEFLVIDNYTNYQDFLNVR